MSQASRESQNRSGSKRVPAESQPLRPSQDVLDYVKDYAKEKPEIAALWCFGVGFILGWKLKPW